MKSTRLLAALAAAAALSGCLSFGSKPPPFLLRLTPEAAPAAAARAAPTEQAITVVVPTVGQELNTPRVPVRSAGGTHVAYVENAQWVDQPANLFARLLSETISARTGRVVLDPRQFTFDPGQRLTGSLHTFGIDADAMQAVVVYDAAVARGSEAVETRRFEARVPIAAVDAASAADALNRAANQVAGEVAGWVG